MHRRAAAEEQRQERSAGRALFKLFSRDEFK
jgi:hypothetical protein